MTIEEREQIKGEFKEPILICLEDLSSEQLAEACGGSVNKAGDVELPGAVICSNSEGESSSFSTLLRIRELKGGKDVGGFTDHPIGGAIVVIGKDDGSMDIFPRFTDRFAEEFNVFSLSRDGVLSYSARKSDLHGVYAQAADLSRIPIPVRN